MQRLIYVVFFLAILVANSYGKNTGGSKHKVIITNFGEKGTKLQISFTKDKSFDQPTFVFWVEDLSGKYIETLYVTNYLATGIFKHSKLAEGQPHSKRGPAKRPSSLPYWLHKRNIRVDGITYLPTPEKPIPDAITGATPKNNFILETVIKSQLPQKFRILFEINQPWDYNDYWNKDKFPGEFDYTYSCQPAIVYAAEIELNNKEYSLKPIGHSHYSGLTGELFSDISTLTTAKNIAKEIKVQFK